MDVGRWRQRFAALNPKPIDLSLSRMQAAATRLGHPERRLAPHIHIAGTNGKGGVVAALEAALTAAGQRVQSYSSPFLWNFEENIRLNGVSIEPGLCARLFEQLWTACSDIPLTWFEADTLVAFLAFDTWQADVTLIECGMGGGSDATALARPPLAAILTNVGGDHAEFLGTDLSRVAQEKAGIAKGAPLYVPANFPHDVGPVRPVPLTAMHPSLTLANAVLSAHFPGISPLDTMPAQMGRWSRDPGDPHTLYDVGHNAHAARFLARRLAQEPGPYLLELGMLHRKGPQAFLEAFAALGPYLKPVDLGTDGHTPAHISRLGQEMGIPLWHGEPITTRLVTGSHQTVAKLMPFCMNKTDGHDV